MCITGHSRNGKQSVIAAAFDTRITAAVGSSPGVPVSTPWQFGTHNFYGEPPAAAAGTAPFWWLASAAEYDAHPENLPMDGHGLLAMVAPRALAICTAWTDHEGDISIGTETGARAAREVYALVGAKEALHVMHRPGDHHGFIDVHAYFDWFDVSFGRLRGPSFALAWAGQSSPTLQSPFTTTFLTAGGGFEWAAWNASFAVLAFPIPEYLNPTSQPSYAPLIPPFRPVRHRHHPAPRRSKNGLHGCCNFRSPRAVDF